jgi:hypothetical protein
VILIGYDGSADAQAAIDQAGALLSGEPATIVTVLEPFLDRERPPTGAYYADRSACTDSTAAAGMTSTGRSAMCSSSCETLPSSAQTRPRPRGRHVDLVFAVA